MGELKGRVALITGASRGIGRAIAKRFAAEGASVVVCATRMGAHGEMEGTLEGTVESIQSAGGKASAIVCDLSDVEARSDLIERAGEPFGTVDVLVNNAACSFWELPSKTSSKQRNMMFDVNVNAPVELAQQALTGMREKGGGWVLNIASATAMQAVVPYRDTKAAAYSIGGYGASKAALNRYTEVLGHELGHENIYVNSLSPEAIVLTSGAAFTRRIAEKNPDMLEPVEMMAEAALVLCSQTLVGQVAYSRQLIHMLGRKVRSLDGKEVLGDAFLEADINVSA